MEETTGPQAQKQQIIGEIVQNIAMLELAELQAIALIVERMLAWRE